MSDLVQKAPHVAASLLQAVPPVVQQAGSHASKKPRHV
jgi:hypothetical protein